MLWRMRDTSYTFPSVCQVNLFILGGSAAAAMVLSAKQWVQTTPGDPTKQELSLVPFSWTVAELPPGRCGLYLSFYPRW